MTTDTFADFLAKQEFDRAETRRLSTAVETLSRDVAAIHASRHATQENLATVIDEMRIEHGSLEVQVSKLVESMRELVIAMEGSYGSKGIVSRIESVELRTAALETMVNEGAGMRRLLGWGAAIVGAVVAVKALFAK
jgi:hypothetical protein